jgi:2-polyprenyl-3-methyl-5-hydroxy-6-metoxy-1,4-benzoquinol methylase
MQMYLKSVEWTNRLLVERIRAGRVLDVGGAHLPGRANLLAANGLDIVLVDPVSPPPGALRSGVRYLSKFVEDLDESDGSFDHILLSNVLEHVDEPFRALRACRARLRSGGNLHLLVPNCESLNRRIGVAMGVLSSIREIPEKEIAMGHKCTFSVSELKTLIIDSGLRLRECFGTWIKPVPTPEMIRWPEARIRACFEIASSLPPEVCHEIYIRAGVKENGMDGMDGMDESGR